MLVLHFKDIFVLIPFFVILFYLWIFFIKNNFYLVRTNTGSGDILLNSNFLKKIHYIFFINWFYCNMFFFSLFFYFLKSDFSVFWFNHLKLNNFNLNLIFLIIIISVFLTNLIKFFKNTNINYNLDYFFSVINLSILAPIIFFSNTMYTFLFILETISLLILYKFSVSRSWFPKTDKLNFSRILPKSYLNMMFFQYWANFFSSMLIMFSIFNILYVFGSSEWVILELLNNSNQNLFYFKNYYFFIYICLSFLIGMFLKIGFTPLHLFKIEVYKGLPFISVFFYTTWYFLSFFLYFTLLIYNNLYFFKIYFNVIFFFFLFIGLIYSIFLLFDVNLVKSFFAYSTVVNAMNFLIVLYLIIL